MNGYILCNFTLFSMDQEIYLVSPEGTITPISTSSLEKLSENIFITCKKYDINKIHLIGVNEYAKALMEEILAIEETEFGYRTLEIEVN